MPEIDSKAYTKIGLDSYSVSARGMGNTLFSQAVSPIYQYLSRDLCKICIRDRFKGGFSGNCNKSISEPNILIKAGGRNYHRVNMTMKSMD